MTAVDAPSGSARPLPDGFPAPRNRSGDAAHLEPPDVEQARYERLVVQLPTTLTGLVTHRVRLSGGREAFRAPAADGSWVSWTWDECADVVRELAAGLLAIGVQAQQPVAIASSTRLEWVLAELAALGAGAAVTTLDAGTARDEVGRMLADSGAVVVVAEDAVQLARVREHWGSLPDLLAVVVLDERAVGPGSPHVDDRRVLSAAALRACGRALLTADPSAVDRAAAAVRPWHLATVMYTSGTTGPPRGVRLSHAAWVHAAAASAATGLFTEEDLQYLWVPLSHSFGTALLTTQLVVGFASAVCGDPSRRADGMAQVRPTVVAGSPRLFSRVHARAQSEVERSGRPRQTLTRWAVGVGSRAATARRAGRPPAPAVRLVLPAADGLALKRVRDHFGGRARLLLSGGAPLGQDVAEWFAAVGLPVVQGYGLTETGTAVTVDRPTGSCPGSVGRPLAGTRLRITADGRILVRGPGESSWPPGNAVHTRSALDRDAWCDTGDTGRVRSGCLWVTGRVGDQVVTADGTTVAPQPVELRLAALCPQASHVVVLGRGRLGLAALVTLDADAIATWASSHDLAGLPYDEVVTSGAARALVAAAVDAYNAETSAGERVDRFAVLPRDLEVAGRELTSAMVPRRDVVERRWAGVVEALYGSPTGEPVETVGTTPA